MKVECGNCGRVSDEEDLARVFPDIPDLTERIAPGEPVRSGSVRAAARWCMPFGRPDVPGVRAGREG